LIMLVKRYIFVTKCNNSFLSIASLKNMIQQCYKTEKIIVETCQLKNDSKQKSFDDKWRPIKDIF